MTSFLKVISGVLIMVARGIVLRTWHLDGISQEYNNSNGVIWKHIFDHQMCEYKTLVTNIIFTSSFISKVCMTSAICHFLTHLYSTKGVKGTPIGYTIEVRAIVDWS